MTHPIPGTFYSADRNDTLLGLTGRAYGIRSGSSRRLSHTQMLNAHPSNLRFHRQPGNAFERNHFSDGIIRLRRDFPCRVSDYPISTAQPVPAGTCRPHIYIPPPDDVWYPVPPEVPQRSAFLCWAAALTSLSQARTLNHRFTTQRKLASAVSALSAPGPRRTRSIVAPRTRGLRIIPSREVLPGAGHPGVMRGEVTIGLVAGFFGLDVATYVGDAAPGAVQRGRDSVITLDDLVFHLNEAGGPILMFRSNGVHTRAAGHVTVIFGASIDDGIYFEMDPFTSRHSGPIYGPLDTRVVRSGATIGTGSTGDVSREIYILF
jgi:hypothetical protein